MNVQRQFRIINIVYTIAYGKTTAFFQEGKIYCNGEEPVVTNNSQCQSSTCQGLFLTPRDV